MSALPSGRNPLTPTTRRARRAPAAFALAAAVLAGSILAGCGGGDDDPLSGLGPGDLSLRVSPLKARAGETITVTVVGEADGLARDRFVDLESLGGLAGGTPGEPVEPRGGEEAHDEEEDHDHVDYEPLFRLSAPVEGSDEQDSVLSVNIQTTTTEEEPAADLGDRLEFRIPLQLRHGTYRIAENVLPAGDGPADPVLELVAEFEVLPKPDEFGG